MKKLLGTIPELPYAVEEALNRLRINIKFCGENTRKILVTSSIPNEGKSFVSVHLWRLLAEAGFKTVLLDVDLRKSVIKNRYSFNCDEEMCGIGHYLSGQSELDDCIYSTDIENAYIIPCTSTLQNPSSLFEDPKFEQLLDSLSEEYRYVIVDSPPLFNVADAVQIASYCDGAVLVIRAGFTQKKLIRQSLKQIDMSGCKLLGTILNFADNGTGKYGKYKSGQKYYGRYEYKYEDYYGGDK